ncbi:MAG: NAD-binding protein, partial [Chloroflexota bacterium]
ILLNVLGITVAALVIISTAVYFLTQFIPFADGLSDTARIAVALLGGTILLALSPASTIAVIQEVRARGPFTKTILSVTVVMDIVIIVLFAISTALAAALLFDEPMNASFVGLLALDLAIAVGAGYLIGRLLEIVLGTTWATPVKIGLVLAIGFGVFWTGFHLSSFSKANFPFEIHAEPLLTAMIAGFYVTNFTAYRLEFERLLHDVSPIVYVAFFTLTGIALKLDVLLASIGIAIVLFVVRAFSIFVGSFAGATLAGEPMRFRRVAWLALITQAGIALGLAREVSVQFPDTLGGDFATLIIAVVVLNEVFGPIFLKFALRNVGESHEPETANPDEVRDAVILGVEPQTLALTRELLRHNWQVIMADTDREHIEHADSHEYNGSGASVSKRYITEINAACMAELVNDHTDALVAMLDNDADNLLACELAYEKYGVQRMVARVHDESMRDRFIEIGVTLVDPASAMVGLLDQAVRTPQASALLHHKDPENDVIQITVSAPDVDGALIRDLRLPTDTLVLGIMRGGHSVLPHGYSQIHLKDEITVVGSPQSLEEVKRRLGY